MPGHERVAVTDDVPRFSIVIETANLEQTGVAVLFDCLASLAAQDLPATRAEEVLIVDSGITPRDVIAQVSHAFPWIDVLDVPRPVGYYEAKLEGLRKASGDVVVYCDSDCRYEPDWLGNLLRPFQADEAVEVVSGSTSIRVTGPFTLAMMLSWSFPPFPRRADLHRTGNYLLNNVAFRREVLQQCPLRPNLPLYRGNCALHCLELEQQGVAIWKQPLARAVHPPAATTPVAFLWRWLLHGRDRRLWYALLDGWADQRGPLTAVKRDLCTVARLISEGSWKPLRRLPDSLREDPWRAVWLPITAGIIAVSTVISLLGFAISYIAPAWLLEHGSAKLCALE